MRALLSTTALTAAVMVAGCKAGGALGGLATRAGAPEVGAPEVAVPGVGAVEAPDVAAVASPERPTLAAGLGYGGCQEPIRRTVEQPPYPPPARPADPWVALDHEQPAVIPVKIHVAHAGVLAMDDVGPCDAAHDHCFRDCSWLVKDAEETGVRQWIGTVGHRVADGHFVTPGGALRTSFRAGGIQVFDPGFIAYRTVPAARRLLAPGRLVAAMDHVPVNEQEALSGWRMGTVLKLDEAAGTVQLAGSKDTYPLAATRVVVASWQEGGKVTPVEGISRDAARVTSEEVYAAP